MRIIIILVIAILLTGCSNSNTNNKLESTNPQLTTTTPENIVDPNETNSITFKREYEANNSETGIVVNLREDNVFKYINLDEAIDILNNRTGIIYIGYAECPWCRNVVSIIDEFAKRNNIDEIYYLPASSIPQTKNKQYVDFFNGFDGYVEKDSNGDYQLYVPEVFFIKNGEVMAHHLGSEPSQSDAKIPLSITQKNSLINIYTKHYEKIK